MPMTNMRKYWFTMITGLILAFYFIWIQFHVPYLGITVAEKNGQWVIGYVEKEAWAAQRGIRQGDVVKELNSLPPSSDKTIMKYKAIPTAAEIVLERNGELHRFEFRNAQQQPVSFNQTVVPIMLFSLLYLFSVYIHHKKPDNRPAVQLILFFMCVSLAYLSAGASVRGDYISRVMMVVLMTASPAALLQFVVQYFRSSGIQVVRFRSLALIYTIITLWVIISMIYEKWNPPFWEVFVSIRNSGVLVIFAAGMIYSVAILMRLYIRCRTTVHKDLLKYMLIGIAGAFFPFIFLFALPGIVFGAGIIGAGGAASFFLFLPFVFMYLIASNRLLDIDFVMGRLRYYCLIAMLPTVLLVPGVAVILRREPFQPVQWAQAFLLVYMGIVLFLYGKEVLDRRFRNKLIKGAHRYQESLDGFARKVARVMQVNELERCLANEVCSLVPIRSVGFLELGADGKVVEKWHRGPFPPQDMTAQIREGMHHFEVGDSLKTGRGYCYVIGRSRDVRHLMWIGDKVNRMEYNYDEKIWLRTLAVYVGFVYENLQLIEGLVHDLDSKPGKKAPPWVLRLLFRLSEQERRRLAGDLHDSALQDQLLWYRKLEALTNDSHSLSGTTKAELIEIQEGLLDVMHQIRQTCNELRPPFLQEMGVVEALDNLCRQAQLNANYTIDFSHPGFRLALDDDYVLTIYRITQELLRNSMKHSKATKVELSLRHDETGIRYAYRDNGIGMEMDRLKSSFQHMGLSGIRERVWALEGTTTFRSALGEGFEVMITLPLPADETGSFILNNKEELA